MGRKRRRIGGEDIVGGGSNMMVGGQEGEGRGWENKRFGDEKRWIRKRRRNEEERSEKVTKILDR